MSAAAPSLFILPVDRRPVPAAVFEILGCLAAVAAASLAFVAGWLSINAAVVLTVVLLAALIVLSWVHLGQGRHPVFLFLCTLMFFQGGRLLAFCMGAELDPMRVRLMAVDPFTVGRSTESLVLLCLALSAICIYGICRWRYVSLAPPDLAPFQRYLPYLYLVYAVALPAQTWKNYLYFQYVQQHGYLAIYQNYAGLAESAPLLVRAAALFTLPAFVAIYVFESRRILVVLTTVLYFAAASLILASGSRLFLFALVLTLWYVHRLKSTGKPHIVVLLVALLLLAVIGQFVANLREDTENTETIAEAAVKFVAAQGASLDVTQLAVRYTDNFSPYIGSYLVNELGSSFGGSGVETYARGRSFDYDLSVFINSAGFSAGFGVGSSYIAESYLLGGVAAVVLVSLLIACGLQMLYRFSASPLSLCLVALTMPVVLYMPRGDLFGWLATLFRNCVLLAIIALAWKVWSFLFWAGPQPGSANPSALASPTGT